MRLVIGIPVTGSEALCSDVADIVGELAAGLKEQSDATRVDPKEAQCSQICEKRISDCLRPMLLVSLLPSFSGVWSS